MASVFEDWAAKCDDPTFRLSMIQVHDELWTAQKIVEARFGEKASSDHAIVLPVFRALSERVPRVRKEKQCL